MSAPDRYIFRLYSDGQRAAAERAVRLAQVGWVVEFILAACAQRGIPLTTDRGMG